LDFSGLGWGELVEQRGARPYRPSKEVLAVKSQYGQLHWVRITSRFYLFELLNEGLIVLVAHFFDV